MTDCIFCKIVAGELPATIVHETERVVAFRDIDPQAPVHVLVVPRRHIATLHDVADEDGDLVGEIFQVARRVADNEGIAETGYRTVFNCGGHGGQDVYHLHLHLLGGRQMAWPPG